MPERAGDGPGGFLCPVKPPAPSPPSYFGTEVSASPCPQPPCMMLGCDHHHRVALGLFPIISPPLRDPAAPRATAASLASRDKTRWSQSCLDGVVTGRRVPPGRNGADRPHGVGIGIRGQSHAKAGFWGAGVRKLSCRRRARAGLMLGWEVSMVCASQTGVLGEQDHGRPLPCAGPSSGCKVNIPLRGDLATLEENHFPLGLAPTFERSSKLTSRGDTRGFHAVSQGGCQAPQPWIAALGLGRCQTSNFPGLVPPGARPMGHHQHGDVSRSWGLDTALFSVPWSCPQWRAPFDFKGNAVFP